MCAVIAEGASGECEKRNNDGVLICQHTKSSVRRHPMKNHYNITDCKSFWIVIDC